MSQDPVLREEFYALLQRRGLEAVEQQRPTVDAARLMAEIKANANGPDLHASFYDEIAKIPSGPRGKDGVLQHVLDDMADNIERLLAENRIELSDKIYVGQYPHGSFNAQSMLVQHGILISLNSGLMMFIHQAAKVMAMATRFTAYDEDGGIVPHPEITDGNVTREKITGWLADIVLAYILFGDSTKAARLPSLGGVRLMVHSMLASNAEMFALAHEYGHVIDGHFNDIALSSSDDDWIQKKYHQEFAADEIAMALMVQTLYEYKDGDTLALRSGMVAAGCAFLFALDLLIQEVRTRIAEVPTEPVEISSHPPAGERLKRVLGLFQGQSFNLSIAQASVKWVLDQIDPVIRHIQSTYTR